LPSGETGAFSPPGHPEVLSSSVISPERFATASWRTDLAARCSGGLPNRCGNVKQRLLDGFAAGALLVMLVGSMIPEATEKAHDKAGLAAVLGVAPACPRSRD
jgi:hypothetical protein